MWQLWGIPAVITLHSRIASITLYQLLGEPVSALTVPVVYRGGVWGVQIPSLEILKALQNRAKLNPIVKTVKNC